VSLNFKKHFIRNIISILIIVLSSIIVASIVIEKIDQVKTNNELAREIELENERNRE